MIPYVEATLAEVQELLKADQPLAFDTETCGLYGRIRLAQFYQTDWPGVLLVNNPDPVELAVFLAKLHIVMHNGAYDVSTIQAQLGTYWAPNKWDDTFYLGRLHYYEGEKFSLDATFTYLLGYDPYRKYNLDKTVLQKSNWDVPVLTKDQKLYAAIDVFYLIDLYNVVKDAEDTISYKLDIFSTSEAFEFQTHGMPVDSDRLEAQYKANLEEIAKYNLPINVNSYQQVRPYIGSNRSDALGLSYLTLEGNERAKEVNTVRKLIKQNSFLAKFDTPDGRIYGKFAPSARSGRYTCKDQNLEQLPRKTKGCFGVATDSGRVLVYSDYAQLELRAACAITGEPRMETLFREGEDLHDYTARFIFGEGFTKTQRQITKTCNFNLLYGGGHKMLGDILVKDAGILLTESELKGLKNKWRNLWKTLVAWQDAGISDYRNGRFGKTPFGRRYTAKLMTDQLNIEVQGFGSEVAKLALHYMMPKLLEMDDVWLCNFIHDSYIIECDNDEEVYKRVSQIVAEAMQEAWVEACRCVEIKDLPMPVAVMTGYNWGDIEKGDYLYKLEA